MGDQRLWWVIAKLNNKPTEAHCTEGDKIKIPTNVAVALGVSMITVDELKSKLRDILDKTEPNTSNFLMIGLGTINGSVVLIGGTALR